MENFDLLKAQKDAMMEHESREKFERMVSRLAYDFRSETESDTLHKAILHAYDCASRPLMWTTNKPTQPGWYWWHGRPGVQPEIHYLTPQDIDEGNPPGLWAGPIPEPREGGK